MPLTPMSAAPSPIEKLKIPRHHDCTTPLEDLKLQHATDYMQLVSSGVSGLGIEPNTNPAYGVKAWPPGPKPEPYKWKAPDGTTWTQVLLDGKWMYQWSKDKRMMISASNLYDLMGVQKDPETGMVISEIPGEAKPVPFDWDRPFGVSIGWWALGALVVLSSKGRRR